MTIRQRWKRKRDLALAIVALHDVASQEFIGDVFDLHRGSVSVILEDLQREFAADGGLTLDRVAREIRALRGKPSRKAIR